jgi:hypothetical protein
MSERNRMVCYICAGEGKRSDAVAVCIVCGMALCADHAVREDLPVLARLHTGLGEARRELPERLPRFLCPDCYRALHQANERA